MAGLVIAHDDAVAPRARAGLGIVAGASFVTSLDALVLYVAFGAIHRDFPHIGAPAPDARVLIAARVLQGFGAAALTPASLALILRAFPKSRVPRAIALWAAVGALAAALGPTVGGLCVEAWGWRSVFVLNVPIGVAVALLGPRLLDESREPAGSRLPDPVGTVLVTAALVLLALALAQSSAWGWSSARTVGALLGGIVMLGAFVIRCASVVTPVLALDLFSERGFRWANLGQLVYGTGFTDASNAQRSSFMTDTIVLLHGGATRSPSWNPWGGGPAAGFSEHII